MTSKQNEHPCLDGLFVRPSMAIPSKLKDQRMSCNLQCEHTAGEEKASHEPYFIFPADREEFFSSVVSHLVLDFHSAVTAVSLFGVTSSPPAWSRMSNNLLNKNTDII